MSSQRSSILDGVVDALTAYYGAQGAEEARFRQIRRGPLVPVDVRPAITVCDNGQSRETSGDEESQDRKLSIRVVLHLAEDWEKVTPNQNWSDRVEELVTFLQNRMIAGQCCVRMDYVSDDPVDVVFTSGASEAIWVVEFEALYAVDVDPRGEPDRE